MNNACSESLLHYNERENKNRRHPQNTSTGDKIGDYGTELQYFIKSMTKLLIFSQLTLKYTFR